DDVPEAVSRRDAADLREATDRALLRLCRHDALARDVGRLEQPETMFELRHAQSEIVQLLAACETDLRDQLLERLLASQTRPLRAPPPRRQPARARRGGPAATAPPPPRQVVGEVVRRLGGHRRPSDPGQERRLDRPAGLPAPVLVAVHVTRSTRPG